MDIFSLPDEIMEKIFLKLSPYKDFDVIALVCKRWNTVISDTIKTYKRNFHHAFETGNVFWTELHVNRENTTNSTMSKRFLQSMCYNDNTRSVYIFGGRSVDSQSAGFNDLWRVDMHTMRWERVIANGDYPQPQFGCTLESYENMLILFGGRSMPAATPFSFQVHDQGNDDMHIFDTQSSKWSLRRTVDESPPPLYLHGSCVVTSEAEIDCMAVFGGITADADTNALWCLDLPDLSWWKAVLVGEVPPARHMHSQVSLKTQDMFSSAILIVGGYTVENYIFSDVWILIRSGFKEWTASRVEVEPGPPPPMSIFKRKAVKVGDNLVFFGNVPSERKCTRRNVCMLDPYQDAANRRSISEKEHHNPIYMHVMDLRMVLSKGTVKWTESPLTADSVPNKFLGPNRPNYHVAVQCRGHVLIHGDYGVDSAQHVERTRNHNDIVQTFDKWPLFYLISAETT